MGFFDTPIMNIAAFTNVPPMIFGNGNLPHIEYSWGNASFCMPQINFGCGSSTPNAAPVDTFEYKDETQAKRVKDILYGGSEESTNTKAMSSQTTKSTSLGGFVQVVDGIDYAVFGSQQKEIKYLAPEMQRRVEKLFKYAKQNNLQIQINSGYRTKERQKELAKEYANQPGRVADPEKSKHVKGLAVDINIMENGKKASSQDYKLLADYAKSIGMKWGGDFRSFREEWHFEMA